MSILRKLTFTLLSLMALVSVTFGSSNEPKMDDFLPALDAELQKVGYMEVEKLTPKDLILRDLIPESVMKVQNWETVLDSHLKKVFVSLREKYQQRKATLMAKLEECIARQLDKEAKEEKPDEVEEEGPEEAEGGYTIENMTPEEILKRIEDQNKVKIHKVVINNTEWSVIGRQLPRHWQEQTDPDTDETVYYNTEKDETQSERPINGDDFWYYNHSGNYYQADHPSCAQFIPNGWYSAKEYLMDDVWKNNEGEFVEFETTVYYPPEELVTKVVAKLKEGKDEDCEINIKSISEIYNTLALIQAETIENLREMDQLLGDLSFLQVRLEDLKRRNQITKTCRAHVKEMIEFNKLNMTLESAGLEPKEYSYDECMKALNEKQKELKEYFCEKYDEAKASIFNRETTPFDKHKPTFLMAEKSAKIHVMPDALPAGWRSAQDQTSGKPYYYNENTGKSQWKKPGLYLHKKRDDQSGKYEYNWSPKKPTQGSN